MPILKVLVHLQPIPSPHLAHRLLPSKPLHLRPVKQDILTKRHDHRLVTHCVQSPSGNGHGTRKATERLLAAIANRDLREFYELIAHSLQGKQRVVVVLCSLVAFILNNTEFAIKPTEQAGGADIGLKWNFEWKTPLVSLGEAFSIYTAHVYQGKIYFRNNKAHFWPLLDNMELLRLKMEGAVTPILEKIGQSVLKEKTRMDILNCFLGLLIIISSVILWKNLFM